MCGAKVLACLFCLAVLNACRYTKSDEPSLSQESTTQTDLSGHPRAKTIEWLSISTPEGITYLGHTVQVDKIFRKDVEDLYGVNIRLENLTQTLIGAEYTINFYNENEEKILDEHEKWRSLVLEPFGFTLISGQARIKGAVGFVLYVRKQGDSSAGEADKLVKTTAGSAYLNRRLRVIKALCEDGETLHVAEFSVKNMTGHSLDCEYTVEFYNPFGEKIEDETQKWQVASFAPYEAKLLKASSSARHAIGFKLLLRYQGSRSKGAEDK